MLPCKGFSGIKKMLILNNSLSTMMRKYAVYILQCSDNSYYTGVTNNVERRVFEHNTSTNEHSYTYSRRPAVLVFVRDFTYIDQAIEAEKQIKGWSRRKKEAIIQGNWNELPALSSCQNESHSKNNKGSFDSAQDDRGHFDSAQDDRVTSTPLRMTEELPLRAGHSRG